MGERTRSRIGTMEGVKTVRVYSANPKTADGYNTLIFRRDIARSLNKLAWAPVIDARQNRIPVGIELSDVRVQYSREQKKALILFLVEQLRKQYGPVDNDDFGRFVLQRLFAKEVQRHALATRREYVSTLSARSVASGMVHFAAAPNEEIVRRNGIRYFEYGLAKVRMDDGLYLIMGEVGVRSGSSPYYDQHVVAKFKADSEVSSLQGHIRIGESAFERIYDNRFRLILQGVAEYYAEAETRDRRGPKISVIVPVYKVEPYLRRCVDSILAQTYCDFELILVDDGSPDRCGEICDEYAKKDRRVVVIHQENAGLSAARNAGIDWAFANSTSEHITFIDSDDWVSKEYLEGLVEGCDAGHVISCARIVRSDGTSDLVLGAGVCKESVRDYWVRCVQSVNAWGKLYPKKAFARIRFPVGKIHEDTYVVHRIIFAHQTVGVSSRSVYHYFIRNDSITGSGRTHCWTAKSVDAIAAFHDQITYFSGRGFEDLAIRARQQLMDCYLSLICEFGMSELRTDLRHELRDWNAPIVSNRERYYAAYPLLMPIVWPVVRLIDVISRRGLRGAIVQWRKTHKRNEKDAA